MHQHPHTPADKINTKFRDTVCNTHEGILVLELCPLIRPELEAVFGKELHDGCGSVGNSPGDTCVTSLRFIS